LSDTITARTVDEYRQLTQVARTALAEARMALIIIHQEEGWRLMGYNSFREYIAAEFPEYSHQHLYRQVNAGLLESSVSPIGESLVGRHPESHMRAITETLSDPQDQHEAYWQAQEAGAGTAEEYKMIAARLAIWRSDNGTLKQRVRAGQVAVEDAYRILQLVPRDEELHHAVLSQCNDPQLVIDLLSIKGSETWTEVIASLCIPAYDEPIPLSEATSANLRAWLDISSAEHRARWLEDNRERLDERRERLKVLVNEVVELVPEWDKKDELMSLVS
jgi:hypothetical protein